jgi:hypothetical protein
MRVAPGINPTEPMGAPMTVDPTPQTVARFVAFVRDHPEWDDNAPVFVLVWMLHNLVAHEDAQ